MIIKVRADLTSDERINVVADSFVIGDKGHLLLFNGEVMVAAFRQWAYVITDPRDDADQGVAFELQQVIKPPEPRPLNLGQPREIWTQQVA